MSEVLPDGWICDGPYMWRRHDLASASVSPVGRLLVASIHGPKHATEAEANTDRLNMIAGLEGRPSAALDEALALIESMVVERNELLHAADLAAERAEKYEASLDRASARIDAVVEKLDALGVPSCGGLVERIEALATQRNAALAKAAHLTAAVKSLTEAGEHLERNLSELEDRRDADEAHVAELELELSEARLGHEAAEKSVAATERNHRRALANIMGLRTERDNLLRTIATQQTRIDGLTAEASDKAPQLLRDSMRMTQEENARLRADLATLSEGYARIKSEREACAADVTALRKQLVIAAALLVAEIERLDRIEARRV